MVKELLFKLFSAALFLGCSFCLTSAFGQAVTVNSITGNAGSNGLAASPVYPQSGVVVYGLSITTNGNRTITQFNLPSGLNNLSTIFTNGKLFRSNSSTYTSGSVTQIAGAGSSGPAVSIGANTVNVSGLAESIPGTTLYYYLMVDYVNNGSSTFAGNLFYNPVITYGNNEGTATNYAGSPYYEFRPVTLTVNNNNGGLTSNSTNLYPQNGVILHGFSAITPGGTATITQLAISGTNGSLNTYFSNAKLYRSTSSTYNGTAVQIAGAGVGGTTANFNGGNITFTGLSESITSSSPKYYYLVLDYSYTGTGSSNVTFTNVTPTFSTGSSTSYQAQGQYYGLSPVTLTIANVTGGLTSNTNLYPQNGVILHGFSAVTPGGTATVTQFAISGTNASLNTYFSNAKLYRSTNSSYNGSAVQIAGAGVNGTTATVNAGNITFSGISESINSTTTKYYYLVLDYSYGGTATSNNTFTTVVPTFSNGATPSYQANGTYYNLYPNSYSVTNLTGGIAPGDLYYGESNLAVFGVSVTSLGAGNVATINIQSNNNSNLNSFFTGKFYRNTTTTYGSGTATQIGTVTFSNAGVSVSGLTEQFAVGETKNYFLVVSDIYYSSSNTPQVQFNISNNTSNSFVSSGGGNYQSTSTATSATFTLKRPDPTVTLTGINGAINGITQGSLSYGQKNIVLFGFKLDVLGVININEIRVNSNTGADNFFTNGKLYRSTTPYFANAQPVAGTTFAFNNPTRITGLNEAFTTYNTPTTYYYFIVADLTATTYFTPGTFQYNFVTGTSLVSQASPYKEYSSFTTSNGVAFNIVNAYRWTGNVSNDFTAAGNFTDLQGNGVSAPGAGTMVQIGVVAYTRQPILTGNMNIGGITFGTLSTPSLTINSGTLTMDKGINLINATTATINGPGVISLTNTAISTIGTGATLNLSNTTLSNAGTFTAAPTAVINLPSNGKIVNTGAFTLSSNVNGSAAIGQITGTSSVTGNITVERYVSGGNLNYRGYRLFSSPVNQATIDGNRVSSLGYLKNGAYLTGTTGTNGGFDVTSPSPTIFAYREDKIPSTSVTGGNYRGINKINNANAYDLNLDNETGTYNLPAGNGIMFFFRGNRATNSTTSTTAIPDPVIFSQTGNLNQGDVIVKNWYTPSSSNLGYTGSGTGGNATARGYNLVGNPYASTIDWSLFSSSNSGAAIYGPNVSSTFYTYNVVQKRYETHNGSTGTTYSSKFITSGQGFFVLANNASASLKFTEAAKVPTLQNTGTSLLMGTAPLESEVQFLRLQLSKDQLNSEDVVLQFNKTANDGYLFNEDSPYLRGSNAVSFSTTATDNKNIALTINQVPFPKKRSDIPLNVVVNATGMYQIKLNESKNIPKMFDVWLKDAYTKDSLDLKNNNTYNFNVNTTDAATSGASRFSVIIRPNTAYSYHLLDFAAKKQNAAVQLSWKVENEENYTFFTVERSTNGGKTFDVLGSAVGKSLSNYSLDDNAPVLGENQYRLKQEDYFGTISYSNIIPVMYTPAKNTIADDRVISVYPNPTNSNINIAVKNTSANAATYSISITNTSGRTVKKITSNQPNWQGNISDLIPGTYYIQVVNNANNAVVGKSTFIKI